MPYEVIILDEFENEFKKFIGKLDKSSQAKVSKEIDLLEKYGLNLGMPYSKKIDSNLWELRTGGKQKVRILYQVKQTEIYLLNWFVKKSQKTPKQELEKANKRLSCIYHL